MAAPRGLCSTCGGEFAVANDGTPYKHTNPSTGEPCAGSDSPVSVLADAARYLVYGGEVTEYCFVVIGPVEAGATHAETFAVSGTQSLPLLGEVASSTPEAVNPLLPEGKGLPEPDDEG